MKEIMMRDDLSIESVYESAYQASGIDKILVEELLRHVAHEFSLPVEKLRISDRFDSELAPHRGNEWDSGYAILMYELRRAAKKKGVVLSSDIVTVDDYIRTMAGVY